MGPRFNFSCVDKASGDRVPTQDFSATIKEDAAAETLAYDDGSDTITLQRCD